MGCNSSKTTSTTTGPAKQNNDAEHTNGDAGTTDQQNNTDTKAAEQGNTEKDTTATQESENKVANDAGENKADTIAENDNDVPTNGVDNSAADQNQDSTEKNTEQSAQ